MTKSYTAEDRAAILSQIEVERKSLLAEIGNDLDAIARKIAEAQDQNLFVGPLPNYLLTVQTTIQTYRLNVTA